MLSFRDNQYLYPI